MSGEGLPLLFLQQKVSEFNVAVGQEVNPTPRWPKVETLKLYLSRVSGLLPEELDEIQQCLDRGDFVGFADNIVDLIYVACGLANACGVNLGPVAEAIHEANMKKLGGGLDANGKAVKPKGWTPPDIAAVLRAQGADEELLKLVRSTGL